MMLRVYRKTKVERVFKYIWFDETDHQLRPDAVALHATRSYCDGCGEEVHPQQLDPDGYLICTNFEGNFRLGCQYLARGLDLNYG